LPSATAAEASRMIPPSDGRIPARAPTRVARHLIGYTPNYIKYLTDRGYLSMRVDFA
jgi:hypothetical protein